MNWLFILVWLTLSSCTIVDAKVWGHKEEHVEVDASGRTARLREEKICEPGDKMCQDEAIIERRETIITHEPQLDAHLHKEKVGEAVSADARLLEAKEKLAYTKDRAGDKTELAGEKTKYKAREAYDAAAEAGEKAKHKTKEAYDSAAEGASHAGEKIKHKAQETYDSASEGASYAGEKIKHKAQETYDSAATGLHSAKEKIAETAHHIKAEVEEHIPILGAEKLKHKAQEAYDSATEGVSQAGEKVKHKAQEAYDSATAGIYSAKEKTELAGHLVREKLWVEKPIVFTHPIIPGFRAWLAIFGSIGAQLFLGWAWYNLVFKKPFRQALAEDRAYKFATISEFGMTDKLSQAAHSLKDKAASSTMGQKLSHSTAAQKASQAGEMLREKVAEGRDKASQAGEMLKEKAAEGRDKLLREKDSKMKSSAATSVTATTTPVMTQQVFSSTTPHVTTTTMPVSTAPTVVAATTTTVTTTSTALPKETTDAAEAAFLREKEKPLLTFEPTAGSTGEFIAGPYSAIWGPISSVFVSTIRSFFMFHWLRVLLVNSAFGALAMAFYFFLGSQFCSMHHYIWEGRPLKLLLIDHGAELALSAATAWIVYEFGIAH